MNTQAQNQFRIFLVGDACEDVYHYGSCTRLSPEAPVPVFSESHMTSLHGMSSNVCANLRALGTSVVHIRNDTLIQKHRFIDLSYGQQVFRCDIGDSKKIDECHDNALTQYTPENFDCVVISDYNKGFIGKKIVESIKKRFAGIPIFVDTKKKNVDMYGGCFIKINDKEYQSIISKPTDCRFIVTLGKRGAMYNESIFPTKKVDVFDVCGAGDVFLSGLVYGFMNTGKIEDAIEIANNLATISVTKQGTYVVCGDDL